MLLWFVFVIYGKRLSTVLLFLPICKMMWLNSSRIFLNQSTQTNCWWFRKLFNISEAKKNRKKKKEKKTIFVSVLQSNNFVHALVCIVFFFHITKWYWCVDNPFVGLYGCLFSFHTIRLRKRRFIHRAPSSSLMAPIVYISMWCRASVSSQIGFTSPSTWCKYI